MKLLSHVRLLATPWTAAYQAPPSMGFFQARVLEWGAIAFSSYGFRLFHMFFFSECNAVRKATKLEVYLGQQIKSGPQGEGASDRRPSKGSPGVLILFLLYKDP